MSDVRAAQAEPLRTLLAALSGAAGVIHLAMVPSHMDEWALEGVAFAVAGWFQLAWAVLVLVRSRRELLRLGLAANVVFVGAWAFTRTLGPPFGPHAGHAESVSLVDLTTVGLQLALVALAAVALFRPALGAALGRVVPTVAATGVVLVASVALASPSARDHAHDSHGGHGDGHDETAASGHDHATMANPAAASTGDDRGLSDLRNGHHHEIVAEELDAATQADLDEQLAVTREVAAANPTVAAAEANGYRRIGPYFPGIGAHYGKTGGDETNRAGVMDRTALLHPLAIIYDGTAPTSRVAGFMYLSLSETEPEGFAGPNDVWHYHEQLCLKYRPDGEIDVPFGLDKASTDAQCEAAGGGILPVSPWMVHVWSAPGWDDDPDVGTFGEVHTDLTCSDGTYHMLPADQWASHQHNICSPDAA